MPIARVEIPGHTGFCMACPNAMALWRARSVLDKEPETIRWLNGFAPCDTLLDVGANIGVFTLYAAMRQHCVMAIEPEASNFALLNRNIYLNKFDRCITAYNLALAESQMASILYLSEFGAARALHTVGRLENYRHEKMTPAFQQGVWQLTLDEFLAKANGFFPNHIKIDVDGAEARIVGGAMKTLRDHRLKSVLIELNEALAVDLSLVDTFEGAGLRQVDREHAPIFDRGEFSTSYNYIFAR